VTQTSPLHAIRLRPRGLPQRLPEGERLLWQGSPRATTLMRRAFHIGMVAAYFALIVAWSAATVASHGADAHAIAVSTLHRVALAAVPLALIALYSWAIQRSTIYTITTRRVVISFGIALPVSFNIPFTKIAAANLRQYPGGAGDIALQLLPTEQMSYMVMWPHARPWRMARTEPMLRGIPGALEACEILSKALAEDAQQPHTAPTAGQQARPARPAPNSARRPAQPAVA
jgi:hypothetical protein